MNSEDRREAKADRRANVTDDLMAALALEVGALADAVVALEQTWRDELTPLRDQLTAAAQRRFWDRIAALIGAVAFVAFAVFAVGSRAADSQKLAILRAVALENHDAGVRLVRCTTPTPAADLGDPAKHHACFEESRAFSLGLTLAIVECSGLPHDATPAERRRCVADQLAAAQEVPRP